MPAREDVLDGHVPPPVGTGPRTRFTRRRDYALLAVLVVALVVAAVTVWQTSEIRATTSTPTASGLPEPVRPELFPPSLGEAWRAPSGATWTPVAVGPVVVTGDGGEVTGRDPETGEVRWSYRRDLPLCTVASAWNKVVSVYRTDGGSLPDGDARSAGGCSEVTAIKPDTGERDRQRNSDAEVGTRLLHDDSHLTTTGSRLLTTLRSDLVKTVEYGGVPAQVNPGKQPRTGCEYGSVVAEANRIAVIERCPEDQADRLTVYKAGAKDSDTPEVSSSKVLGSERARVVAVNDKLVAVAVPDPAEIQVYDELGTLVATHPIALGADDLRDDPEGGTPLTVVGTGSFQWFTGSRTIALSAEDLRPLWTVADTIGPGTVFLGRALLPVRDGLAVVSQSDGAVVGTFGVDRAGHSGLVTLGTTGPIVLEQRGATLVALR